MQKEKISLWLPLSPISCGVLLVGQKGRGRRGDGKVRETDQNGSPKTHIEREGRNQVWCGDKKEKKVRINYAL